MKLLLPLLVLTATVAACSDDAATTDDVVNTVLDSSVTTTIAGSQDSIPGSADTTAPSDTPARDPNALAEARVQAALAALPTGWLGEVASNLGEESVEGGDIVFTPCLGPDDYDADNLDADSAASWKLKAEGPQSPTGEAEASVEARVFVDPTTADGAFSVLAKVLGTDEGRECLALVIPGQMAQGAPAGGNITVVAEATTIPGVDVGARLIVTFNAPGFAAEMYVDLVASKADATSTVFATFISFGAPTDQAAASAVFVAALRA